MGMTVVFVYFHTDVNGVFCVGMEIVPGLRYTRTFAKPAVCVGAGIAAAQAVSSYRRRLTVCFRSHRPRRTVPCIRRGTGSPLPDHC